MTFQRILSSEPMVEVGSEQAPGEFRARRGAPSPEGACGKIAPQRASRRPPCCVVHGPQGHTLSTYNVAWKVVYITVFFSMGEKNVGRGYDSSRGETGSEALCTDPPASGHSLDRNDRKIYRSILSTASMLSTIPKLVHFSVWSMRAYLVVSW